MMRKLAVCLLLLAATGATVTAYALGASRPDARPDCPGKIVCPLTGELVCRDRCPLGAGTQQRPAPPPPCCGRAK